MEPKGKGGRPRKAPDEQRAERLPGVRLTPAERHYVELTAERAGLSVMEFSRRAILGQRLLSRRRPTEKITADLLAELNRVGVNINQIAHAVNSGRGLPHDMPEVVAELRAVLVKIAEAAPDGP
jgi:hypothetical protein